jgi:hypothetical protein
MAGDITEINLNDPQRTVGLRGKILFFFRSSVAGACSDSDVMTGRAAAYVQVVMELEANNLEDENGDVKKGKYMEDGWVDDGSSGPGFWENLGNMMNKK